MEKEKKYLLLNWVLLIGYGCINLFALYGCAYSWPTQGSFVWFLPIIFCAPFLYHLVFIIYVFTLHKILHWKKTYRLVTLLCGILLAGGLLQLTQKISVTHFKTAYAPMILKITQNMPMPCKGDYFEIASVKRYNASVISKILIQNKPEGRLLYNTRRFILNFRGGSIDMNNSTLFYDSETKIWHFFHNDTLKETANFAERTQGLIQCRIF